MSVFPIRTTHAPDAVRGVQTVSLFDLRRTDIVHLLGMRLQVQAGPVTYTTRHGLFACTPTLILDPDHVAALAAADPVLAGLLGVVPQAGDMLTLRGSRYSYWVRERPATTGNGRH